MAWGRAFAACVRAHGIPTFPDPAYPTGAAGQIPAHADAAWALGLFNVNDKSTLGRAMGACPQLVRQMPPPPQALEPPTAAMLHHMRQWAQCLRAHGQAGFPDPNSDGKFPILNTPYEGFFDVRKLTPTIHAAMNACQQYTGDWEMKAS
ncbi:MAG: hypothetical protein LBV60_20165 [Streptomyces sp.]|jgi:hypothetical protein|nr:hypothetical protein [Streptomyces sp.]